MFPVNDLKNNNVEPKPVYGFELHIGVYVDCEIGTNYVAGIYVCEKSSNKIVVIKPTWGGLHYEI